MPIKRYYKITDEGWDQLELFALPDGDLVKVTDFIELQELCAYSQREAFSLAARLGIEEGKNKLLRAALTHEIKILEEQNKGTTHYAGCIKHHTRCAAILRMSTALGPKEDVI